MWNGRDSYRLCPSYGQAEVTSLSKPPNWNPLHLDDVEQLVKIRRYLIGYRITNGWTQAELSQKIAATKGNGWVYDLESNPNWNWRMSRLQDWTQAFGLKIQARAWVGLDRHDAAHLNRDIHDHPEVAPLYALAEQAQAWPKWQRAYLTSALTIGRKQMGISAEQMGDRLGVTAKAIWNWENTSDEIMLPKVLAYARALGGHIKLSLSD